MPTIIEEFSIATAQYQTERLKVIEALKNKKLESKSKEFDTVTDKYIEAVVRNKYVFMLMRPTGLEPLEQRTQAIEKMTLNMKELYIEISENNLGMIEKFMNNLKSDTAKHNAYTEMLEQERLEKNRSRYR